MRVANPIMSRRKCSVFVGLTRHYTIRWREEDVAQCILKLVTG
jgi:hypothetical protein